MAIYTRTLYDALTFSQSVTTETVVSGTNQSVTSEIVASQTIALDKVNDFQPELVTVDQTIDYAIDRATSITDTLIFTEKISAFILKPYASALAKTRNIDPVIAEYLNGLTPATTVTWSYNEVDIELRAPAFSDTQSYDAYRVNTESRGREMIIFKDSIWPTTKILAMEFDYLSETQAAAMLALLQVSVGQTVTYTDHFGRVWSGHIINPEAEVLQKGPSNFTLEIEFQGVLT